MDWKSLAKENEGLHTVESFSKKLGIGSGTAVNYLHALRKKGFVETERGRNGKRLYKVSPLKLKKIGYPGLYETINKYSSLKITSPLLERSIHEIKPEEAIVKALGTKDFRVVMTSLELFKHVNDWLLLYKFAKEYNVERHIGALYFLSRRLFRVRKIDKRVLRLLEKSELKEKYIVPKMKSSDFGDIEKKWDVFIPFNKSDLERFG
jgi:hypothetical protein